MENNNLENQQNIAEKQGGPILYAGFGARLAGYFIDYFLVNIISFFLALPLGFAYGVYAATYGFEVSETITDILGGFIGLGIGFGYYVFMTYKYQATLGKMAVGIRVLNDRGQKPSLSKVILREVLGKIVSSFTLGIGFLMAAFTDKKQALHDIIGKTIVVCKDQKNGANKPVVIVVNVIFIGITMLIILFMLIAFAVTMSSYSGL